jgi:hypothetical protein
MEDPASFPHASTAEAFRDEASEITAGRKVRKDRRSLTLGHADTYAGRQFSCCPARTWYARRLGGAYQPSSLIMVSP